MECHTPGLCIYWRMLQVLYVGAAFGKYENESTFLVPIFVEQPVLYISLLV
jgi:hypothetical protein